MGGRGGRVGWGVGRRGEETVVGIRFRFRVKVRVKVRGCGVCVVCVI
jgi:hypothetical protein